MELSLEDAMTDARRLSQGLEPGHGGAR